MSLKKTKIIWTLGRASYKKKIILELKKLGVSIFRINLSTFCSRLDISIPSTLKYSEL